LASHALNPTDHSVENLLRRQNKDLHLLHRLDTGTSGVLLFAKTPSIYEQMREQFKLRTIQKYYRAWTAAVISQTWALPLTIDAPLAHHEKSKKRMIALRSPQDRHYRGKPLAAITRVLQIHPVTPLTEIQVQIITGVMHQIRVHLASRGLPLVADTLYGGKPALGLQRQALHATQLRFSHPLGGQTIDVHCEPPLDFAHAWQQLFEA
jgi:23S rRNA pseudouridine1911/1915/1917 synthase